MSVLAQRCNLSTIGGPTGGCGCINYRVTVALHIDEHIYLYVFLCENKDMDIKNDHIHTQDAHAYIISLCISLCFIKQNVWYIYM